MLGGIYGAGWMAIAWLAVTLALCVMVVARVKIFRSRLTTRERFAGEQTDKSKRLVLVKR